MNRLQVFLRLSAPERRLLIRSALLLATVRLGLSVLSFQTLRRLLGAVSSARVEDGVSAARVGWAIARASQWVPSATCLVQALAAQVLLRRRGRLASVRIGVARGEGTAIRAHAWVESEGLVVFGARDHAPCVRLPRVMGD